jgi:hypothetical protein
VGYGRGTDFVNVYYGLLMLFVLGVLYGFLGGGFFGLALTDSRTNRIKWASLLTQMIAMGLLTYGVLINQLEWFMTPPRSEMWAACLGASIALAWYVARHRHGAVMKVAVWSAVGAGFGFAFGNFLQVVGNASGIAFNFWNVMEYSIGFFGGAGMAYATLTASWPATEEKQTSHANLLPILFVTLFIPFVVWDQSFVLRRFDFILDGGGTATTVFAFQLMAILGILGVAGWILYRNYSGTRGEPGKNSERLVKQFFVGFTSLYIFLSFLITGVTVHPLEQYLYVANLMVILVLIPRAEGNFMISEQRPQVWLKYAIVCISVLAVLALIAINSHDAMPGSQVRFGNR